MNLVFFQPHPNILTILITISILVTYFAIPFSLLRFQRRLLCAGFVDFRFYSFWGQFMPQRSTTNTWLRIH